MISGERERGEGGIAVSSGREDGVVALSLIRAVDIVVAPGGRPYFCCGSTLIEMIGLSMPYGTRWIEKRCGCSSSRRR